MILPSSSHVFNEKDKIRAEENNNKILQQNIKEERRRRGGKKQQRAKCDDWNVRRSGKNCGSESGKTMQCQVTIELLKLFFIRFASSGQQEHRCSM